MYMSSCSLGTVKLCMQYQFQVLVLAYKKTTTIIGLQANLVGANSSKTIT